MDATVTLKPIPGYPAYFAGDDGSIWSLWHRKGIGIGTTNVICKKLRRLKPTFDGDYCRVNLSTGCNKKTFCVGVLILLAFRGPPGKGQECRHLDGTRKNNWLSNLEWGTRLQNMQDKNLHGTQLRGPAHPNFKHGRFVGQRP